MVCRFADSENVINLLHVVRVPFRRDLIQEPPEPAFLRFPLQVSLSSADHEVLEDNL